MKKMTLMVAGFVAGTGSALADVNPDTASSDLTPPSIIATSPANGAECVTPTTSVSATFSEEMHPKTLNASTFKLEGPSGTTTGTVNYADRQATLAPAGGLKANVPYKATVTTGTRDLEGNALTSNYTWDFNTTCAQAAAPAAIVREERAEVAAMTTSFFDDWYIAPMAAGVSSGIDNTENGMGYALSLGKELGQVLNLELAATRRDMDFQGLSGPGGEADSTSLGLQALAFITRSEIFAPFVMAGAGADRMAIEGQDGQTDPYATAGLGFTSSPWRGQLAIRGGVQYLRAIGTEYDTSGDVLGALGLQLNF